MNCPSKVILSVVFLFENTLKDAAGTLFCASPQYIILGETGILECSFPNQFYTIAWYDSPNTTEALDTKIEKQDDGTSEVSGDGYTSGAYDIWLNGSLIIPSVTTYHDRTFRVVLVDESSRVSIRDIDCTTIVNPLQTIAAVNLCEAGDHCFVDLMETGILNCTYTGARPAVKLTWYNNNREESLNVSAATLSDGNYTFTSISSLDVSGFTEKPLTVFTCEASGPALNFKNITTTVFVYNSQNGAESLHANITERKVILNSTLIISCTDVRTPTVFVWNFKRTDTTIILLTSSDGETEVTDNLNDSFEVSNDGVLFFKKVDYSIEGLFTCIYLEDDVSSLNMVRVAIVESKDGQDETDQTFPTAIVVIIVIVLIITIIGLLCCVMFRLRKQKRNQDYDRVGIGSNFSRNTCSVPLSVPMEETSPPPPSLDMEPCAVDMPESVNNKIESSEEISVTSPKPNGEDESGAEVDMEHTTNKDPDESEESIRGKSFNGKEENHPDEKSDSTNIISDFAEEVPPFREVLLEHEISVMQCDGKNESGPAKVESSSNKSPEAKEESFNRKVEDRPDEINDSTNISSDSESEDEFYDANEYNVDEYNDALNVNPESVKMLPLQSSNIEEENYANEKKDSASRDFEDNDTPESGTAMGAALSNWRLKVDHEHKLVDSIEELAKGDHIVFSGWALHPRCHGIVVDTNMERNKIRLVRFTYEKGVIEEWKKWKLPIYKVTRYYIGDKSISSNLFESNVVINRARSRINNDRLTYNIATNNCKTFARWCKTGATPAGEFGYD